MEVNWTVLSYFVIGLFALNGFFRGWWKEAISTVFLVFLVFLLAQPQFADDFIGIVNTVLDAVYAVLPSELLDLFRSSLQSTPGTVSAASSSLQIDPGDGNTWLVLLITFVAFAVLVSRFSLPDHGPGNGYAVRPVGSILGGLVGGLNGLIIINLVREYVDGRNLPAGTSFSAQTAGGGSMGIASSGVTIQAVQVPNYTILDSYLPWIIIIIGLLIFFAALKNRVGLSRQNGFSKVDYKEPLGYRRY
jgi:hypothetical protein